jgi:hypothetical protein
MSIVGYGFGRKVVSAPGGFITVEVGTLVMPDDTVNLALQDEAVVATLTDDELSPSDTGSTTASAGEDGLTATLAPGETIGV